MPDYRRPLAHGFQIFFTVALAHRGSRALVENIDVLRAAVRQTRAERPFTIDAWVVLQGLCIASGRCPQGMVTIPRGGG